MRVLLLDNYDSFTYNLLHYVESFDVECVVVRNNEIELDIVQDFDKVIISPGPGLPRESGRMMDLIDHCIGQRPLLGVCLGMQGIAEHFGGSIYRMESVSHGVALESEVIDEQEVLFNNLPRVFVAGMYHSWAVSDTDLPHELIVTARGRNGLVMALRHKTQAISGVQFHPESIMTPHGKQMIGNWLKA